MATNEVPRGPISGHVVANVKRLRAGHRWSLADLSEELAKVGRPILPSGLHRLEQGKRRVDVDDVVALAAAFGVAPISMLLPFTAFERIELTATIEAEGLAAWYWMRALRPLDLPQEREEAAVETVGFIARSVPMGARAVNTLGTQLFNDTEGDPEGPPLDWDAFYERRERDRGVDQEAP